MRAIVVVRGLYSASEKLMGSLQVDYAAITAVGS